MTYSDAGVPPGGVSVKYGYIALAMTIQPHHALARSSMSEPSRPLMFAQIPDMIEARGLEVGA